MAATVPVLGIFKVGIGIKLMHVIPRGKGRGHCMYTIRLRESALEVDSGIEFPWHTGELNMH